MTDPVFRFAPSPNGRLHLGHAYSALLNLRMARAAGGRILLRIEDTDRVRCRPDLERQMLADLEWLGFEWDDPPLRQSDRLAVYRGIIDDFLVGGLAYPAFMSRASARAFVERWQEVNGRSWPCDPDGTPLFPPTDRQLASGERDRRLAGAMPHSVRLDIAAASEHVPGEIRWDETGAGPLGETGSIAARPSEWGDILLAGRDIPASYHLASVVDDAFQGVTHVVRGRDLFHATSVHRLLQEILGYRAPSYHHHDLVLDDGGEKLSKSRNDTSLADLRTAGLTPVDIRSMIGLG